VLVVAAVVATGVVEDVVGGAAARVDGAVGAGELLELPELGVAFELPELDEPFDPVELGGVEVELGVLCLTGSTYCWSPAEPPPPAKAATGTMRTNRPARSRPTST
jgi:hypothetical protein